MPSTLPRLIKQILPYRAPPWLNVKPNICLPPVAALEESPLAKDKERDLSLCVAELFSCGLINPSNDWPGGLL